MAVDVISLEKQNIHPAYCRHFHCKAVSETYNFFYIDGFSSDLYCLQNLAGFVIRLIHNYWLNELYIKTFFEKR